jgi:HK97 gp10 family phage protein
MRVNIETDGFKELDNALAKLPDNIARRALQGAVTGAMRHARNTIRAAAPVGEEQSEASKKYGRLSKNIKVGKAKNQDKMSRSAFVNTGKAFWGYFIEKGTRYIPAAPWFVPAFESATGSILDELKKRLGDRIDKEFKKLAK